jgi:peptidoglycan/xylan/chitin deacetylase (PgdA/CDA1 family)
MTMRAISLGYHDVVDEAAEVLAAVGPVRMVYKLDRRDFCNHLRAIRLQAGEARVQTIDRRRTWRREQPVFLTIDDGALSGYTCIADELELHNWRGHFFITTDWIGRPGFMDRWQLRELRARGHVIGSHSRTHPERMSQLGWGDLLKAWFESCDALSGILGERVSTASVAGGFYSRKVARAAAAAAIEVLFTSEPTTRASVVDGCLVLGRYSIQRRTPFGMSGAIAAGEPWPRWRQTVAWKARKAVKAVTGESYLTIRRLLLSGGARERAALGR